MAAPLFDRLRSRVTGVPAEAYRLRREARRDLHVVAARQALLTRRMREEYDLADALLDPRDRFGDADGLYLPGAALGTLNDRRGGKDLPFFWTELDLRRFRWMSRYVCDRNPFAIGFMGRLTDFHIKTGFGWQACLKGQKKGAYDTGGAAGDADVDPAVRRCQTVLDEWRDAVNWPLRSREAFRRLRRDGEVFQRLGYSARGELPWVRWVEPEQVGPPPGERTDGEWSFGCLTARGDVETALAYWVRDPDGSGQEGKEIGADRLLHLKANVDGTVKRGLPDFFPVQQDLERVRGLLSNMSEVARLQAAIAWIQQYATATPQQVATMIEQGKDYARPKVPFGRPGRESIVTEYEAGSVLHAEGGRVYTPGPVAAGVPQFVAAMQAVLRAAGARWGMPEYFSGDASNNNFASSLVSGSPFVSAVEGGQMEWGAYERRLALRVLALAAESGRLTRAEVERADVETTAPQVALIDKVQEAQRNAILYQNKVISLVTWQLREGVDPKHEAANVKAEAEEDQAARPQQPPGGQDDDGTGGGGLFGESRAGEARIDAVLLGENFTGQRKDKSGRTRCYRDGVIVPCKAAAPQKKQAAAPQPTSAPGGKSGTLDPAKVRAAREAAAATVRPPKYVTPPPEPTPSPKAEAALRTAPKIGVNEQSYAEDYNEVRMATLLGGGSFPDSEECDLKIAADPAVGEKWSAQTRAYREQMTAWKDGGKKGPRPELPPLEGEVKHLCEMKTPVVGRGGISMNAYAIVRKVLLEKASGKPYHTIVCDHRGVFNANGPGEHGDPDAEVIYYRRGVGNAEIPHPDKPGSGSLHRCKDRAELERLMDLPDDELPEMAKRRDQDWHKGTWRPLKGERGYVRAAGYKLDENGEPVLGPDGKKQVKLQIVRPKP